MAIGLDIFSRADEEISGMGKQRRIQKAAEAIKQGNAAAPQRSACYAGA
ncbi:hypothetical protein EPYR_00161 [Erwinia pyrifoliae DSM 12163]|nr:hypothetical protein EPYR_00161 [Erwinia pyrifoliae DSM 12163]